MQLRALCNEECSHSEFQIAGYVCLTDAEQVLALLKPERRLKVSRVLAFLRGLPRAWSREIVWSMCGEAHAEVVPARS